tara:strand:- start:203 stop:493 length:291 start_codon:yes stop_codon:yes gene_type:complete
VEVVADLVLLVVLQIHKLLLDQVVVKVVVDLALTPLIMSGVAINQEYHKIFLHLIISNLVILEELQTTQDPTLVVEAVVPVALVDQEILLTIEQVV